jgi:CDP-paratose 2-epimerase
MTDVENVIKEIKPDVIFHLCGQVAMTTSVGNPRLDFEINGLGTFNLLESVKIHCPHSIVIYSSSNKVYGDLEWVNYSEMPTRYVAIDFPDGFSEDIPLDFRSPYGCSKGCADQYMLDFYRMYGIRTVVFRHSSMFGGRQFSTYDQGWIGWFCQKAVETKKRIIREPFTISGSGKQVRDVLYVDDMINLYFMAFEQIEKTQGQSFNIGGGVANSLSLLELFGILENDLAVKLNFTRLPPRQSDQKVFIANIAKAQRLMGWTPMVDKDMGIKNMIEWVRENDKRL